MNLLILVAIPLLLGTLIDSARRRPPGDDPGLTEKERAKAIELLIQSRKDFLEEVEGLSDAQWNFKSSPFRWSVGEVAEHIMLSESLIFGAVERALAASPDPDWESKTSGKSEFLERALLSRNVKARAPEAIQPRANLSRAEIMERYRKSRDKTLDFVRTTQTPMKGHVLDHPFPIFGTLNAYQWLIYIPLHNMRHNSQIVEVKADPDFPRE